MKTDEKLCGTCIHMKGRTKMFGLGRVTEHIYGDCRRFPPYPVPHNLQGMTRSWTPPAVRTTDQACAEHKAIPKKKARKKK